MADLSNLFQTLEEKYGFPGGKFVKDRRFEVLAQHSSSELYPNVSVPKEHDGYDTYIAKDKP